MLFSFLFSPSRVLYLSASHPPAQASPSPESGKIKNKLINNNLYYTLKQQNKLCLQEGPVGRVCLSGMGIMFTQYTKFPDWPFCREIIQSEQRLHIVWPIGNDKTSLAIYQLIVQSEQRKHIVWPIGNDKTSQYPC